MQQLTLIGTGNFKRAQGVSQALELSDKLSRQKQKKQPMAALYFK